MSMNVFFRSVAVLSSLGLAACSSDRGATIDDATNESNEIHQEAQGKEVISAFDLNNDKKPDVWSYTVPAKGDDGKDIDKLVRKELDINWDGKVDITRVYGNKETIEK